MIFFLRPEKVKQVTDISLFDIFSNTNDKQNFLFTLKTKKFRFIIKYPIKAISLHSLNKAKA